MLNLQKNRCLPVFKFPENWNLRMNAYSVNPTAADNTLFLENREYTKSVVRGFLSLLESKYMNHSTRKSHLLLQYLIQGEFQEFEYQIIKEHYYKFFGKDLSYFNCK